MTRTLLLLGMLLAASPAAAADLNKIRDELREVQTSFASIRMEYVQSSPSLSLDYTYLQSGPRMRVDFTAPEIGTVISSFDGKFGYEVLKPPMADVPEDNSIPHSVGKLRKFEEVPESLPADQTPLKWFGMPVSSVGKPLWELLDGATIVGESSYNDWPVVKVDLGEHPDFAGRTTHIRCLLSKNHGYVPVVTTVEYPDPEIELREYVVEAFEEVEHPLLGRTIWFPKSMTFGPTLRNEVTLIELNPALSKNDFVPVMEDGMQVNDETAPPGKQRYVQGADSIREQIVEKAKTAIPPLNSGITTAPDVPTVPLWTWLLGIGIATSIAALIFRARA